MNNFFKFIYYLFNVDINEELIKSSIRIWLEQRKNYDFLLLGILNIGVTTYKSRIDVNILLQRPGRLIGKRGTTIRELEEYLTSWAEIPVKVYVFEGDVFRHKNNIRYFDLWRNNG